MHAMTEEINTLKSAPLHRQLFAMFYDSWLIVAMLFIATALLLPFNSGESLNHQNNPFYSIYLASLIYLFYAWFWHKGGQTLGMKVWKVQIIHESGYLPSFQQSFVRWFFSLLSILCFGLGYWWHWFFGYTWHDKISGTRIVDIRKIE